MNPNFQLVKYQHSAVDDLTKGLSFESPHLKTAAALKAPTGAGKTIVMIGTIESLFQENERRRQNGLVPFVALWVSDSPSLNEQSIFKIAQASSVVDSVFDCQMIEAASFRGFEPGKVYFVNYSKLTASSNLNKRSETRYGKTIFELMEMLADSSVPVFLLIDEAHKGTKQKGSAEASTIGDDARRQTIVRQIIQSLRPDKVLGVSATPGDFRDSMEQLGYDRFRDHEISKRHVIESGMIKSHIVNVTLPEGAVSNDLLVKEAGAEYGRQCARWLNSPLNKTPILLVQVGNDFDSHASQLIQWLLESFSFSLFGFANAFGEHQNLSYPVLINNEVVDVRLPYIEANSISEQVGLQVVFFKEALGEGWDCPRAEILVSLRSSGSETRIEQTVGRILRNPFIKHMDYYNANKDELGKVYVYTAKYDQSVLQRIADEFAGEVSTKEVGGKDTHPLTINPVIKSFLQNGQFESVVRVPGPDTYSEHIGALAEYVINNPTYSGCSPVEFIESLHESFAEKLFALVMQKFEQDRFNAIIRPKLSRDEITLLSGQISGKGAFEASGFRSAYDINIEYDAWSIWGVPELKDELLPVMMSNYTRLKDELGQHDAFGKYKKETICQLVMLSMKTTMKSLGADVMDDLRRQYGFVPKERIKSCIYNLSESVVAVKSTESIDKFDLPRALKHRHYDLLDPKMIYTTDAGHPCQKISFDSALESKVLSLLLSRSDVDYVWRNESFGIRYTKKDIDEHVFMPDYLGMQDSLLCVYEPKTITQDYFFDKLKGAYLWQLRMNASAKRVEVIWFVQMEDGRTFELNLTQHGDVLIRSGAQAVSVVIPQQCTRVF